MSFIFMIMAVPFLSATGIYNPQVMHHGHCIAEPAVLTHFTVRHPQRQLRTIGSIGHDSGAPTGADSPT